MMSHAQLEISFWKSKHKIFFLELNTIYHLIRQYLYMSKRIPCFYLVPEPTSWNYSFSFDHKVKLRLKYILLNRCISFLNPV